MLGDDLIELLGDRIPNDHSRQTLADSYIASHFAPLAATLGRKAFVMDLGCGRGESMDLFRAQAPTCEWIGLDIAQSPEVDERTRSGANFHTFDGEKIPMEDETFDFVFCKQVLEHVCRPHKLLPEVARTLKKGGYFAGSTSQLEPFHSYSTFNYSPYAFSNLIKSTGLELVELRPGIDALTLIVRRGLGSPRLFARWWAKDSPLNSAIQIFGLFSGRNYRSRNAMKLLFCGQFCFLAKKIT